MTIFKERVEGIWHIYERTLARARS